jgi:hypothetical protein
MTRPWTHAYGEFQLPFLAAAGRALRGQLGACPKCHAPLRAYFHVFQVNEAKGTMWLWCGNCYMHAHLPRVQLQCTLLDPFGGLSRTEFAQLESATDQDFMDRLEALWDRGLLKPAPAQPK